MIICHSHRFLFVRPKKVASTSVASALLPHLGRNDRAIGNYGAERTAAVSNGIKVDHSYKCGLFWLRVHSPLCRIVRCFGPSVLDYQIVTLAQNPWDRAISEFFWVRAREKAADLSHTEQVREFETFLERRAKLSVLRRLLDRIEGRQRTSKLQQSELCMLNGEYRANKVVFYEDLEGGLESLSNSIGLEIKLPEVKAKGNHRPAQSRDWRCFPPNGVKQSSPRPPPPI